MQLCFALSIDAGLLRQVFSVDVWRCRWLKCESRSRTRAFYTIAIEGTLCHAGKKAAISPRLVGSTRLRHFEVLIFSPMCLPRNRARQKLSAAFNGCCDLSVWVSYSELPHKRPNIVWLISRILC
jgi:hypothetical protein